MSTLIGNYGVSAARRRRTMAPLLVLFMFAAAALVAFVVLRSDDTTRVSTSLNPNAQTSPSPTSPGGTTPTTGAMTSTTVCYQMGRTGSFGDRVICGPGPIPADARPAVPMVVTPHGDRVASR